MGGTVVATPGGPAPDTRSGPADGRRREGSCDAVLGAGLPGDAVLEGPWQRFDREERALQAGGADIDTQLVEDILAAELRDLAQRLAPDRVGQHRGGGPGAGGAAARGRPPGPRPR